MQFVTKAQWGGRPFEPNGDAPITSNRGVKVHYLGSAYRIVSHSECAANGDTSPGLNRNHYAVLGMVGTEMPSTGLTYIPNYWNSRPTEEMKRGIRDAIAYLRYYGGAGSEILGHRDGYATACPGPALYDLVRGGDLEPGANSGPMEYVTGFGETLGSVAAKFDVPWWSLVELNGLPKIVLESYEFAMGTKL
ncbi:LysM peptidoglycan-binding domain-containing protein, partial [Nocardiopsis sp. FR26]|uniref:LysM peptidoglycan-binding domain-containing protein n=1 Tax=Nocardiopsis sp. FR26 TaxID=2605987 RepID=UPI001915BDF4